MGQGRMAEGIRTEENTMSMGDCKKQCFTGIMLGFFVATGVVSQNANVYYQIYDSATVSITVTPPIVLVNNPFTVNATISPANNAILDTVEVRVFTQFPDNDPNTQAVFHLEQNLENSAPAGGEAPSSSVKYNRTDTLFGRYVISQGSFTASISTITGNFVLEAWIKLLNIGGQTDIFSSNGFTFGINADRVLYFIAVGIDTVLSNVAVGANAWSHVAISRANGTVRIYINAVDVSDPVQFTSALLNYIIITCPVGGLLDEVRISDYNRMPVDSNLPQLDIPLLQNPTWIINGTSVMQPMLVINPGMWNDDNIQFQFASPVPGKVVVNFQHKGPAESRWSKNGNPVYAAGDLQGPYVTSATFIRGETGCGWDTLLVRFSEPVQCDSLKQFFEPSPWTYLRIIGPGNAVKEKVWEKANSLAAYCNNGLYILEDTIIVSSRVVDGIDPDEDRICLIGPALDTAWNYADTMHRGPIIAERRNVVNEADSNSSDCGCGAGTGLALLPPLLFKIRRLKRRRPEK
jgi:hypothetical protein